MKTELEVCVVDAKGVAAAIDNGADWLELCSALEIGGVTPTRGFAAHAVHSIPARVLIRPRGGDFVYSQSEIDVMLNDITDLRETGVKGFVIGALTTNGELDIKALESLLDACKGFEVTLHRAFDHASDQESALEQAIELGFHRILSSGGCGSAIEGLERLGIMKQKAGERIRIVPGGGISVDNIETILTKLQPKEVHASCRVSTPARPASKVQLGSSGNGVSSSTNPDVVRALANLVHGQS